MKKLIDYLWRKYVATNKEVIAVYGERIKEVHKKQAEINDYVGHTSDCCGISLSSPSGEVK